MKLWLIERADGANGFDMFYGFVVRAQTAEDAFRLACVETTKPGVEWTAERFESYTTIANSPFKVIELAADGEAGVILVDHVLG